MAPSTVPPSGGSLEIGNKLASSYSTSAPSKVPPSGGSLEIGNVRLTYLRGLQTQVPPSGGSLEIGNAIKPGKHFDFIHIVPPSGGSLEIGNFLYVPPRRRTPFSSPFGGIPRNWKLHKYNKDSLSIKYLFHLDQQTANSNKVSKK